MIPVIGSRLRGSASDLPRQLGSARSWRRVERAVVRDHRDEVRGRLEALRGLPVSRVEARPAGIVSVAVPGWTVTLGGVAEGAVAAVVARGPGTDGWDGWVLGRSGRYGRFWWVEVAGAGAPAVSPRSSHYTLLGSHLRLVRTGSGPAGPPGPAGPGRSGSLAVAGVGM